ncbi:MAG: ABC transporter substrate-binding protein [Proteobacteria bacterium]|nr:ABC transporter substrate-binding protein [Pseudomonadota bacterium]
MRKFGPVATALFVARAKLFPVFLGFFLTILVLSAVYTHAMSAAEERGRKIYATGVSPSGEPISAYFGANMLEIPGQVATCGSCHGHDGTGRPESGLLPTNITWKYLTKSYGHVHASGLEHPPFTEESLKDYLRSGIYPGGETGDPSMPVYDISDRDLDDLVAFMRLLGETLDSGLSDASVRIGTLVPSEGRLAETGTTMRGVLEAYFSEVNKAGGIYGRKIELVVHGVGRDRDTDLDSVKGWLAQEQPFALVSTFTPDLDVDVQSAVAQAGIPLICPFTLYPIERFSLNRQTFYLLSGLADQVRALVHFAGEGLRMANARIAVLHPAESSLDMVIAAAEKACKSRGWQAVEKKSFPIGAFDANEAARELQAAGTDIVIFLGVEREIRSFLESAASRNWSPYVFAPGVLSGRIFYDAPPSFEKRLYLAYPTLPRDRKGWAVKEFSRLTQAHNLRLIHAQAMISAYSAAKILTEAMRLSGRDLDRTKFVAVLEKFYEFETGLTPPITYTRNRRVGALGAYVVTVDLVKKEFVPVGGWIAPRLSDGSGEWILTELQNEKTSAEGQGLFTANCAACHFPDHTDTKIGPGLKGVFKNPRLPGSGRPTSEDTVRRQIQRGGEKMPPIRNLSEEEVTAIIGYLKTL